jgi:hypothetical protein
MLYVSLSKSRPASRISTWVPFVVVLAQNLSNQHAHGRESILIVSHSDHICNFYYAIKCADVQSYYAICAFII